MWVIKNKLDKSDDTFAARDSSTHHEGDGLSEILEGLIKEIKMVPSIPKRMFGLK